MVVPDSKPKKRGSVLIQLQPVDLQNQSGMKPDPNKAVIDQIGEMSLETKAESNLSARVQKLAKQVPTVDQEMNNGYDSPLDFDV